MGDVPRRPVARNGKDVTDQILRYEIRPRVLERLVDVGRERDAVHLATVFGRWPSETGRGFADVTHLGDVAFTARIETAFRPLRRLVEGAVERESKMGANSGAFVGFAVIRRGSGGELEPDIARLHMSVANGPGRVACVVDPETTEIGLYARDVEGEFHNIPFRIAADEQEDGTSSRARADE